MKTRFLRVLVTLVAAFGFLGASAVTSTPASAGTADYQYTCVTPGQLDWAMAKNTPFSHCYGGMVYERLNGELKHRYYINFSGQVYNPIPAGKELQCVAYLGVQSVVIVLRDFNVITIARAALGAFRYCKS